MTAPIPVAARFPQGVAVDPRSNTIYVAISGPVLVPGTVLVINGRTNTVTATIHVGVGPVGVAVYPKTKTAYVTNAKRRHGVDNQHTDEHRDHYHPVGTLAEPTGVAVDPKTDTAYVANSNISTVPVLAPCPK